MTRLHMLDTDTGASILYRSSLMRLARCGEESARQFFRKSFCSRTMPTFFKPTAYERPLTERGRARTIAAFHLAQGNVDNLTSAEMRRDVLNKLMSPRAVGYWLNDKGWMSFSRKIGRVELLRLTDAGLRTCANSIAGGSEVPTTRELVAVRRLLMLNGGIGHEEVVFPRMPDGVNLACNRI